MVVPIIFGAGLTELKNFHAGVTGSEFLAGFIASAVFGFWSIRFLPRYLGSNNYNLFIWYRIAWQS